MTDGFPFAISQDDINWARQTRIDILERDQLTVKNRMKELTQKLAEKDAENQAALAEKDAQLSALQTEKDAQLSALLAEKDTQLSALLREIELLREELASKKEAGEL